VEVKKKMEKFEDALEDLNKVHQLESNVVVTLANHREVKNKIGKYANALSRGLEQCS